MCRTGHAGSTPTHAITSTESSQPASWHYTATSHDNPNSPSHTHQPKPGQKKPQDPPTRRKNATNQNRLRESQKPTGQGQMSRSRVEDFPKSQGTPSRAAGNAPEDASESQSPSTAEGTSNSAPPFKYVVDEQHLRAVQYPREIRRDATVGIGLRNQMHKKGILQHGGTSRRTFNASANDRYKSCMIRNRKQHSVTSYPTIEHKAYKKNTSQTPHILRETHRYIHSWKHRAAKRRTVFHRLEPRQLVLQVSHRHLQRRRRLKGLHAKGWKHHEGKTRQ